VPGMDQPSLVIFVIAIVVIVMIAFGVGRKGR
jgi:hypothetical protein